MPTEEGEFKGSPTITLKDREDTKYPWSFGVNKAKLALANIDAIKAFVAKHDKPKDGPPSA